MRVSEQCDLYLRVVETKEPKTRIASRYAFFLLVISLGVLVTFQKNEDIKRFEMRADVITLR